MTREQCGARCRAISIALAALAGALFGAGLLVSGMSQPARVLGFLDVTRHWDPTLAFVMGGAVLVYAAAYRWTLARHPQPWFEATFQVPQRRAIDRRLVLGAAIFGVGWGLAGWCPGPAIVSATTNAHALLFVAAMAIGMRLARTPEMRAGRPHT